MKLLLIIFLFLIDNMAEQELSTHLQEAADQNIKDIVQEEKRMLDQKEDAFKNKAQRNSLSSHAPADLNSSTHAPNSPLVPSNNASRNSLKEDLDNANSDDSSKASTQVGSKVTRILPRLSLHAYDVRRVSLTLALPGGLRVQDGPSDLAAQLLKTLEDKIGKEERYLTASKQLIMSTLALFRASPGLSEVSELMI
jgi:hypothetical protein